MGHSYIAIIIIIIISVIILLTGITRTTFRKIISKKYPDDILKCNYTIILVIIINIKDSYKCTKCF